jgi:hypothetical protein
MQVSVKAANGMMLEGVLDLQFIPLTPDGDEVPCSSASAVPRGADHGADDVGVDLVRKDTASRLREPVLRRDVSHASDLPRALLQH